MRLALGPNHSSAVTCNSFKIICVFINSYGRSYKLKSYEINAGSRNDIQNYLKAFRKMVDWTKR